MRVRSLVGLNVLVCPFCSKRIVGDKAACSFSHELPVCDRFRRELQARFPSFKEIKTEPTAYFEPGKPDEKTERGS